MHMHRAREREPSPTACGVHEPREADLHKDTLTVVHVTHTQGNTQS